MSDERRGEREEPIRVGERMEPDTVDVILENRKLSAENADLCQQLAAQAAELTTLLAERDAVLRECRAIIKRASPYCDAHLNWAHDAKAVQNSIDAIIGKE